MTRGNKLAELQNILKLVNRIEISVGYKLDNNAEWLGPTLSHIKESAQLLINSL